MAALLGYLARATLTAGLLAVVLGGAGLFLYRDVSAPGPLAAPRTVVIEKRLGLAGIAALLAQEGVIRHPLTFEVATFLTGRRRGLRAGEYAFPAAVSTVGAIDIIAAGKVVEHSLTIPEGSSSSEVASLVRAAPELTGQIAEVPGEGEILPQTYFYTYGERRDALIARMRRAMKQALAAAWAERRSDLPLTSPRELLTLASLIQQEAKKPSEYAHIAAVFVNRLRLGMPLQSDPTVIFALSGDGRRKFDSPLTRADLGVRSPYNTYLAKGLPPGPTDNPGQAALLAAARPARSDDLYFVADGAGGHVFAKSLSEHDHNVFLRRRIEATLVAKAAFLAVPETAASGVVAAPPARDDNPLLVPDGKAEHASATSSSDGDDNVLLQRRIEATLVAKAVFLAAPELSRPRHSPSHRPVRRHLHKVRYRRAQ